MHMRGVRARHLVILFLPLLGMHLPGFDRGYVYAGDETDYSAPYLTVENGELVTRFPAKEHVQGDTPALADSGELPEPSPLSLFLWGILAAVIFAVAVGSRSHRQRQGKVSS